MDCVFLDQMDDQKIMSNLKELSQRERKLQSLFLKYLNEVDSRMLYAKSGYSSLLSFLVEEFGYSEGSSLKRIQVARVAKKFPALYELIEKGELSLTVAMKLAPYLSHENEVTLLSECKRKSVREVEAILAKAYPRAEKNDSIKPLSEDRIHFSFCADTEFQVLLNEAKDALSHKYPEGKLKDILKEALYSLMNEIKEERVSKLPKSIEEGSRHIPKNVKAHVWERDGGCCSYVSETGRRCASKRFLEFDHKLPWSLGGRSDDPSNVQVLCRVHNRLMAHKVFGQRFIENKIREKMGEKDFNVIGNSTLHEALGSGKSWDLEKDLRMNRFMLDLWNSGGMPGYKKLVNAGLI